MNINIHMTIGVLTCAFLLAGCGDVPPTTSGSTTTTTTPASAASASPSVPVKVDTSLTDKGDATAGEATYKRVCSACHQADGTGMNGMLAANFVKDKARLQQSDSVLLNTIKEGKTSKTGLVMPPQKGNLTEKEMIDVLTYIRRSFG